MSEFFSPPDIANRALQHCGAEMMDPVLGFTENSKNARQTSFVYGKLRRAELRRNVWRFATRKAVIRPLDQNTLLLTPSLWVLATVYFVGSLVTDASGNIWQSRIPNNTGNDPQNSPFAWEPYFGPLTVMLYDSSQSYFAGEVVYTAPGDGTANIYVSLVEGNTLDPSLPNQWSIATVYMKNQVVQAFPAWSSLTTYTQGQTVSFTDGNIYTSIVNGNLNHAPNASPTQWALVPIITLTSLAVPANSSVSPIPSFASPVGEWSQITTYQIGNVVMFNGAEYVSIAANNTGNFPNVVGSTFWAAMTGGVLYMSLIDLNLGNNPANAPALWAIGTTYAINNLVGGSDGIIYKSLAGGNLGNNPTTDGGVHWQNTGVLNPWTSVFTLGGGNQQWRQIGGAAFPTGVGLAELNIVYPLNSGPVTQDRTRNVFRLPSGFLRQAPRDPKQGSTSKLGAPSALPYEDWNFEGNYIVSWDAIPIILRFVADVTDVTAMDDMFCEGLACRIALAVAPQLTQSTIKTQLVEKLYDSFMSQARTVNGIETGATEAQEDDLVTCRL
jgi:hypothetical protein